MNPFTKAVLAFMLAQPEAETRATIADWMEETGGDRDKAAVGYAVALAEDLRAALVESRDHPALDRDPEVKLTAALLDAALEHANFARVARGLLDRFGTRRRPKLTPSIN
jgi:hypothetical protein